MRALILSFAGASMLLAVCGAVHAEMTGVMSGVGDSKQEACRQASNSAAKVAESAGRAEVSKARADGKEARVKHTEAGACDCSRIKQMNLETNKWECNASWAITVEYKTK